jgi:hypothetical protein
MMKVWRSAAVAAATLTVLYAMAASAQDANDSEKYNFFSQPTATREKVLADLDECRDLASTVRPPQPGYVYTPNVAAAAATGLLQGFVKGAQRRHMFDAALRKCMSVKGYARYGMSKEQTQLAYSGSWKDMREKLADRALARTDGLSRLEP